jgi:hypothetical protein
MVLELIRGGAAPCWQGAVRILFNLHDTVQAFASDQHGLIKPLLSSELARYGGTRTETEEITELRPFECCAFVSESESVR